MKHFSPLLLQLSTKGHRSESTIFVFLPVLLDFFNCCWNDRMKTRGNPSNPQSLSSWKPQDPSNFQPIALTSCVGNLFTTILKNRCLTFMTTNGYLDTPVEKAFLPGTPGCLEQYEKMSTVIHEAGHKWHHLNTTYGIWSSGLGEDCECNLTMTDWNSSLETGSSSNSRFGGETSGSHSGWW